MAEENKQVEDFMDIDVAGEVDVESELSELFSEENLEKKTDLSASQIMHFARARIIAERYNCRVLDDFVIHIARLSISKSRKGRGEFVESFKAQILAPLGLMAGEKE